MTSTRPTLAVGMVGYAFMGAAHSQAWRTAPRFFDLPLDPDHAGRLRPRRRADRRGGRTTRLGRDRDRLAPPRRARRRRPRRHLHARGHPRRDRDRRAAAGKHVLCEKPLANTVAEAEAMAAAAEQAAQHGVRAMVGFTYRRVPAIALARRLVAEGRIGEVRHVRAQYLQDWIADPEAPLSWRLDKAKAGSGALGDIGAHIVDLTQHITGEQITEVSGQLETFVKERPIATEHAGPLRLGRHRARTGHRRRRGRLHRPVHRRRRWASSRRPGSPPAARTRSAIEINGSAGSLAFDFEDMNVLEFYDAAEPDETAGFRRIIVTEPGHPYVGAWWPPGHGLGYEHGFTHQVVDLVTAIAEGTQPDAVVRRRAAGAAGAGGRRDQLRHPFLAGDPQHELDRLHPTPRGQVLLRPLDGRLAGRRRVRPGQPAAAGPGRGDVQAGRAGRGGGHLPRRRPAAGRRQPRRDPGQVLQGAGRHRAARRDGDHQPVQPPGVQGGRAHRQQPRRTPLRAGQGAAQHRPRRQPRRRDVRDVGRPRGRRARRRQEHPRRARPDGRGR